MRYPGAVWVPSPNFNAGAFIAPVLGVVQHTMVGSLGSADSYFAQTASQVSAHFGIGFDGTIHQYVDTDDVAWHAGFDANHHYHGIEFEDGGNPDTPMSLAQIGAAGKLIAWLAGRYGWKIQNATAFGQQGIVGHVEVWAAGGHSCPNPTRLAQKGALIVCALASANPNPPEDDDVLTPDQAAQLAEIPGINAKIDGLTQGVTALDHILGDGLPQLIDQIANAVVAKLPAAGH